MFRQLTSRFQNRDLPWRLSRNLDILAAWRLRKMYEVDERDRVVPLETVPPSSAGAPLPLIMADDWRVILAYYAASTQTWTGTPESWIR